MKSNKERVTCSNCRELYSPDDGFQCKSCGKTFCANCQSDETNLCAQCKKKASTLQREKSKIPTTEKLKEYVSVHPNSKKGTITHQKEMPHIPSVYFESHLSVRFSQIHAVIYFMNSGYPFSDAVNQTLRLFPNVKDYQTICDACGRRFAGDIPTFQKWYDSGIMFEKLQSKFSLSDHDNKIFRDLFSKKPGAFLPKIGSEGKIAHKTILIKNKSYPENISQKTLPHHVTAREFRYLGNGLFKYVEDFNIKIDATLSSRDVKEQLELHGLYVKNLSSFYYQLRVKGNLIKKS